MSKKTLVLIGVILLAAVAFFAIRSCKLTDRASFWKGKYEAQEEIVNQLKKNNMVDEEAYVTKINKLQGTIDSANAVIAGLEFKKASQDKTIDRLREAEKSLRAEGDLWIADIDTANVLIKNLTASRDAWIEKFNLTEHQLAEAEKINFALSEKYEASTKRIDFLENYVSEQQKLIDNLNKNWDICINKQRSLKLKGSLKTIAIIGGVVAGGYLLTKKDNT